MSQHSTTLDLDGLIHSWQNFLLNNDWQELVQDFKPIYAPCGTIYELPNHLNRENENLAIDDMRNIEVAEPHYHPDEDIEVYFVLQGKSKF